MITAFLDVFDDKLKKLKHKIKEELEKDRSKRDKKLLKSLLHEAKDLRNLIKEGRKDSSKQCCPKCGHTF